LSSQLDSRQVYNKTIFSLNLKGKVKVISGRNFAILVFMVALFSFAEMFAVAYADSLHEDFAKDTPEEFLMISDNKIILSDEFSSHVVELSGFMDSVQFGGIVNIVISGNGIEKTYQTQILKNGTFQTFVGIDSEWNSGTYDVHVNNIDETKFVQSINVVNQIPVHENQHVIFLKQFESADVKEEPKSFLKIPNSEIVVYSFLQKQIVEISGGIESYQFGYPVEIIISGNGIEKTYQTDRINDGTFQTFVGIDSQWDSGTYDVHVNYIDETKFVQSINVVNQSPVHDNQRVIFLKQFESADVKEEPKSFLEISESEIILSDELSRQTVEVYGKIITKQFGVPVEIIISGNGIEKKLYAPRIDDNAFQTFFEIDSEWSSGAYDVHVNYFEKRIFTETLNVTNAFSQSQQVLEPVLEQVEEQNNTNELQTMEFEIKQVDGLELNSNNSDVSVLSNGVVEYTKKHMTDFVLTGTIPNDISEQLPIVKIQKDGKTIETLYISTNSNKEFFVPISMKKSWTDGLYTAKIFGGELEINSQEFLMKQNNFEESEILVVEFIDESSKQVSSISVSDILEEIDLPIQIISGTIGDYSQHKIDVDISHNSIVIESLSVYGTNDGIFSVPVQIEADWKLGDYDIIAYDMDNLIGQTKFILK
jgi:hypothetical protein